MSGCVIMTVVTMVIGAIVIDMSTVMAMITENIGRWGGEFVSFVISFIIVFIIFVNDKDRILSSAFRVRYFISCHSFTNFFKRSDR